MNELRKQRLIELKTKLDEISVGIEYIIQEEQADVTALMKQPSSNPYPLIELLYYLEDAKDYLWEAHQQLDEALECKNI